eukprot:RCo035885
MCLHTSTPVEPAHFRRQPEAVCPVQPDSRKRRNQESPSTVNTRNARDWRKGHVAPSRTVYGQTCPQASPSKLPARNLCETPHPPQLSHAFQLPTDNLLGLSTMKEEVLHINTKVPSTRGVERVL